MWEEEEDEEEERESGLVTGHYGGAAGQKRTGHLCASS